MGLRDYMDLLRRRRAVAIQAFVIVLAIGIVVTLLSKPIYQTRAKLVVPVSGPSLNLNDNANPFAMVLQGFAPDTLPTQIQSLQSAPFIQRAMERAKIITHPGVIPPTVHVEPAENGSNVILITVEGGNANEVANLANAILDLHKEDTTGHTTEGLKTTIDLVSKSQVAAKQDLDRAENRLLAFNREHRLVQLQAEQKARAEEYADLEAAVREAEGNVTTTQAELNSLQAELDRQPRDFEEESTKPNPKKDKLQDVLDQKEIELQEAQRLYKPTHRIVTDLQQACNDLRAKLAATPDELKVKTHKPNEERTTLQSNIAELRAKLHGYQARLNASRGRFEARRSIVDEIAPFELEAARLSREKDTAQAAYLSLTNQLRDLNLRLAANTNMIGTRKLERAGVPREPIAPRKATNIALTVLLALAVACGFAFLQEYLDDRVNSPEDLERVSALPTLGHVPLMASGDSRLLYALPGNSHVAESYRALRSSIGFASVDAPLRRLQVTSASKGEGKTITSVNLAISMAMDGKRVILVDADLRRPTVHRVLGRENSPGLTEALLGLRTIDEVIQPTDIENLRVVCSGPIPPNPAELLGTRAFDELIEQLDERADIVIFDTPPCMPVTDPLIVAARMDGVVLVLHVSRTKKAMVKHVQELLARARARVVGVVFNQVETSRGGYYYYNYYNYGDGYYSNAAGRGERRRRNADSGQSLDSGADVAVAAGHVDERRANGSEKDAS